MTIEAEIQTKESILLALIHVDGLKDSREKSCVITKLDEALLWLGAYQDRVS